MSTQKRSRACDACHSIKIRCDLGSNSGPPPCQRCTRLGKDCTITPPKRQKDRVAELEAKVQALTRLLEAQGLSSLESPEDGDGSNSPEIATPHTTVAAISKKRRLEADATNDAASSAHHGRADSTVDLAAVSYGGTATIELDQILPVETQARILDRYVTQVSPHFPAVPVEDSLEVLRSTRPRLLQAIIYVASSGVISVDDQNKVAMLLMSDEAASTIATMPRSLELLQAVQLATCFYWAPKHHKRVASFELIELANDMSSSLCLSLGGISPPFSPNRPLGGNEDSEAPSARRAWLVCYTLSACISTYLRKPNSQVWTRQHEESNTMMVYSPHAATSDRLLSQYIRAERLCETIVSQLTLQDGITADDLSNAATQATVQSLQNQILDWQMQVPSHLRIPSVLFFQYAAEMYLHEPVLHTTTNKHTFIAPYIAERLSVTDFPAPLITPEHITSLFGLQNAAHALLDQYCAFSTETLLALPGLVYAPRVFFALYLLVKLYVAVTATGSTYGMVVSANDLQTEVYLQKLKAVATRVKAVDDRVAPVILLLAATRMDEWLSNYKAILAMNDSMPNTGYDHFIDTQSQATHDMGSFGWDEFLLMPDNVAAADFGFDDLFAMPAPPGLTQSTHVSGMFG